MKRRLITLYRIIHTGIVNFIRNISLAVAAIAVMVVTLTIVLFSVITNATFTNTIGQITSKIDVSVFLKESVTDAQAESFASEVRQQPDVAKVIYLNKQQALQTYINENQGNQDLITAVNETGNPIPATIEVFPKNLNNINEIESYLTQPQYSAMQISGSPSYNGDKKVAIDNITHATDVLRKIGIITIAVFAVICALIIFNTIQMAIFNRRDEITIMRLLGASTGYIRGPFIVESIIYGILSGVLSVLIINSAFLAANGALQASSLGLLDISYANQYFDTYFWRLLALQVAIGIIIGAVSSIIATRRYLKFKTQ
ncbi:MAG TPA: permease-like cell division protein FtsX [Candidatus Sulfotelmatobacter sp.]|nr:permease-like cell division protein FtsX [Candidatus Sulfotelmatobacter sp.]